MQPRLPWNSSPDYSKNSFIIGESNQAAFDLATNPRPEIKFLALYGSDFCGKKHLAHLWQEKMHADFWDGKTWSRNLSKHSILDLRICPWQEREWQKDFLHALNRLLQSPYHLLLLSDISPVSLDIGLPDLSSRMALFFTQAITEPDQEMMKPLLAKIFHDQGISLKPSVLDYMALHCPRSWTHIAKLVRHYDPQARSILPWQQQIKVLIQD